MLKTKAFTFLKILSETNSMKLFRLFILLAVTTSTHILSSAQVIIHPTAITGYQFSSKDILNFQVINPKTLSAKVQYTASIVDANGKPVVRYISKTHVLSPGANLYTPTSFGIAQTNYLNQTIAEIEKVSKFLPSGDYTYCIDIVCVDTKEICEQVVKAEIEHIACADVHAEPITPLLLSMPEDEAVVKEKRPNFSWIPPMPLGNNPNMVYTFTLCEIRESQTAEDAIRRNRPLFTQSSIKNISLMFPNQLEDLVEGDSYAWQVSAHIGEQHIATSDVWEFEIEKPEVATFYVQMSNSPTGYLHKQEISEPLPLSYSSKYKSSADQQISVQISNGTKTVNLTESHPKAIVKRGESTLILSVDQLGFQVGEVLIVQVTDAMKNIQYLKIILQDSNE